MDYLNKTKKELVMMINDLPGPKVTMRPRKATLIEILDDRLDELDRLNEVKSTVLTRNVTVHDYNCADCDCTDCACEECDCANSVECIVYPPEGSFWDIAGKVFKVAIIAGIVAVLLSYFAW